MIVGGAMENNKLSTALGVAFLLFSILAPCLVFGQTSIAIKADKQFQFAESYFAKAEYYRAISEYNRFIYFFPQDERVEQAMYKVGESYFKGQRFKKAIDSFNALIDKYHDTDLAVKSYFSVAQCYVRLKQLALARTVLDNVLRVTDNSDVRDEVMYRQGWIYLEMDQWEKARAAFNGIGSKNRDSYGVEKLLGDMNKKKILKTKSPTAAGWLAVVPGAGHLYCKRYRDALIAFLLNGAMILAAYESFDNGNEALGGLITFFEIGLYSGNIYSAVSSAHKYNRKQKRDFFQYLKQHSVLEVSAQRIDGGQAVVLFCKVTF